MKNQGRVQAGSRGHLNRAALFGAAVLFTGCVFGENRQFFSEVPSPERVGPGPSGGAPANQLNPEPSGGNAPAPQAPQVSSPVSGRTDSFVVPVAGAPELDLLFCVDNSLSMADNQAILADSFAGFIRGFLHAGVDFHVGIVTSDVDSSRASIWASRMPGYPGANRGLLLSRVAGERFLTAQSSGLVASFESTVRVGTGGSSREQCLESFIYALANASGSGWNSGFFRKNSLHAFVVVSDENEDIQNGEAIENRVARLKAAIAGIAGPGSRGSRFDFIVNLSVAPPPVQPAPGEIQYYPSRYLAASELLSGHNHDISRNFSGDLLAISDGMLQQVSHEFTLSGRPAQAAGIRVTLDGVLLSSAGGNGALTGYVYHPERNSIELIGSAATTAPGKTIQVEYVPRTGT